MSARRSVRSAAAVVAVLMVGAHFSAGAQAAPGDLDPTFSGDGKQTTDFPFGNSNAAAIVRQPDGKLVAVGSVRRTESGGHTFNDFALARYNPNGSLDTSFSGDGKQTTNFGNDAFGATGVALQGDGKIVAAGDGGGNFGDFALARYNPNGSLDTSFSGDGKQTTDFGGFDHASGVALQADGKIVVVGSGRGAPDGGDFALARYNPNGSLDTSFAGDGKQTTDFGGSDQANGVALQTDGKIVAVGSAPDLNVNFDFALARYNANGSLDMSFSGDGKQRTNFGGSDKASGVAIRPNGTIVVVGHGGTGIGDFALARYNPSGALDPSFSGDGKQMTDFGGGDGANAVALQGNGKIVAVGGTSSGGGDFALARYNPNGSLDLSFSGDGKQRTNFGGSDGASGVALQADGKIVAAGVGRGVSHVQDFAVARYLGG